MKKVKKEYLFLMIILIFAFFLRVYSLGTPVFWVDEATSSVASLMILEKGFPIFDSGLFYDRALLFHYLQAFFLLFGQTEFLARFVSVIFGLLTIVLIYFIGKEYSNSGGIISALFLSVFYLEVFFSRQARFYQFFQLLFFLSLYLLYKSKDDSRFLYLSLISFFITINTQIAGLVLAPFFILHILIYNKGIKRWLSVFPSISLFYNFIPSKDLSSNSSISAINYFKEYAGQVLNMIYLFILFVPGLIMAFMKKKRLTLLIILPSVILLIGVFGLKSFALRYAYFFIFPLILYSSLLMSFMYEKYGKLILVSIFILFLIPSNLFFLHTYVNMIKPVDYNFNDYSAPFTDYKNVPSELIDEMKKGILVSYFSSDVQWYIKKPDYVLPFSMNGIGEDSISWNCSIGVCDRYSGALMLNEDLESYYLVADLFSVSKLNDEQRLRYEGLIEGCSLVWEQVDLKIYHCAI
ncbi:MAG TPA: glycosyltransferase family 39 protein [Candidatus Nanoarchaeia archaeon]|nr:glycosyltransferase family 39 protein [Candidatus Nanoarchaeia archaeon]